MELRAKDRLPSPVLRGIYNAVPTVVWSLLGFLPISMFCYRFMERMWLYLFLFVSLLAYMLPTSQFSRLELSSEAAVYRQLGVHRVNRFVQDGRLVNDLLQRNHPHYRRILSHAAAVRLMRTTYFQERFHWAGFLCFLLSSLYALGHDHIAWALLLLLTNIIYNRYPIWLQQYVRVRLKRCFALT